jgi:hypothetical protein
VTARSLIQPLLLCPLQGNPTHYFISMSFIRTTGYGLISLLDKRGEHTLALPDRLAVPQRLVDLQLFHS